MDYVTFTTAFVTLFVIIDPIGLAPIFVALTQGLSQAARRRIALRACFLAASILFVFGLFGDSILQFLGISLPAFRVSGGLLLLLIALDMLFDRRKARRKKQQAAHDDPAVFPLATPLISGPGSLTAMILLVSENQAALSGQITIIAMMLAVVCIVFVAFLSAGLIEKLLGETGVNVVTRLFGVLLAALSIQLIMDGIRAAFEF